MRPTPLLCLLLGCSTAPSAPGPGLAGARTAPPLDLGGRQLKLTAPSPGSEDEFGFAVAGAGDVDGDGFDDVLVGAHQDDDTAANAGAAFLFMGAEDGLDSGRTFTLLADDGAGADELGLAVAGLGDLDGDGFADLGIGAPRHDAGGAQAGAVYLWLGSEDGPVAGDKLVLGSAGSESGAAVAGLGDVDGDGLPDFAVGGPSQDGSGAVWVLGGGDLSTLATLVAADREDGASYGAALDGGDLDGDGYDDVVVGAYEDDDAAFNGGAVHVHPGGSGGPSTADQQVLIADDAVDSDAYGFAVAVLQDVDGDGFDDLAVGAYLADGAASNQGAIYVYPGSSAGPQAAAATRIDAPDPLASAFFGVSLAGLGDLDGDGYGDLLVGASGASAEGISGGALYIFAGAEGGIETTAAEKVSALEAGSGYRYGRSVALAGDVNGDSVPDFVGGAYRYTRTSDDTGDTTATASGAAWLNVPACYDLDQDGACSTLDCDDLDADAYPGAAELDSTTDCMRDHDADGFGDADAEGAVLPGTDCDDEDAEVGPTAVERCNERDDDCDGQADEEAEDATWWAPDADGDQWTAAGVQEKACEAPDGYVPPTFLGDCDDGDPTVHPGAVEIAGDGIDQDCSGGDLAAATPTDGKRCSVLTAPAAGGWLLGLALLAGRRRTRPGCQ